MCRVYIKDIVISGHSLACVHLLSKWTTFFTTGMHECN